MACSPYRLLPVSAVLRPPPYIALLEDLERVQGVSHTVEKLLPDDTPFAVAFTEDNHTETIAGVEVPLGPAIATLSSVTVSNRAELLATRPWHADQELAVQFLPSSGVQLELVLACGDSDSPA